MFKKKILLAVLIAALLMTSVVPAMAETLRFGTIDSSGKVNMRESPSTSADKVDSYKGGTWMRITDQQGQWYKVKAPDGQIGWIRSDLIFISAAAMGTIGIVDVSSTLTLREGPSTSSRSLGSYPDGTPCILLSKSGSWYHVTVDGKAGYFKASYLKRQYMTYSADLATVVSSNGSVRLRKGPSTDYASIKSVKDGALVMILQKGNDWWKVSAGGSVGFIAADYLKDGVYLGGTADKDDQPTPEAPKPDSGSSSGNVVGYALVRVSSSAKLHLRERPSTSSASLGSYARNTQVEVLEKGSSWCKVRVDGKLGYMSTSYLTFTGNTGNTGSSGSSGSSGSNPGNDYVGNETGGGVYAEVRLSGSSSDLNLRESASTSSRILGSFPNGTMVEVLSHGATWCRVKVTGIVGYMSTRYLGFGGLPSAKTMQVTHPDETYVNMRNAPNKGIGLVMAQVPHGETVEVISYGRTWTQILYNNKIGYMMTRYLTW